MASPLFYYGFLDDLVLQPLFGIRLFKPPIFVFELFHSRFDNVVHTAKLYPPLVKFGITHSMLAVKLRDR